MLRNYKAIEHSVDELTVAGSRCQVVVVRPLFPQKVFPQKVLQKAPQKVRKKKTKKRGPYLYPRASF